MVKTNNAPKLVFVLFPSPPSVGALASRSREMRCEERSGLMLCGDEDCGSSFKQDVLRARLSLPPPQPQPAAAAAVAAVCASGCPS